MNIRNAKKTLDGCVNVEYEHPKYGWIPFTASADDVEPLGRQIYADAVGSAADPDPIPDPTPEELAKKAQAQKTKTDEAMAKADAKLLALSDMSPDEVRAWVGKTVKTVADSADLLATLAVAVSVLSRKL